MGVATCITGMGMNMITYLKSKRPHSIPYSQLGVPFHSIQSIECHHSISLFRIPLSLSWGGKSISLTSYWFQYESDVSKNSNVFQVANKAVSDHFPGEFGSERLVQQVVDHILRVTETKTGMEQVSGNHPTQPSQPSQESPTPSGELLM